MKALKIVCLIIFLLVGFTRLGTAGTVTLTGTGDVSTNYFHLAKGLYVFDIKVSTTKLYENFYFDLLDTYGNTISSLASIRFDHPDTTTISKPVSINYDGNFILSVDTTSDIDGAWEVTITGSSEIELMGLSETGYSFSGKGTMATKLFPLNKGLYIFHFKGSMPDINYVAFRLFDSFGNTIDYGESIDSDYSSGEISKPIQIKVTGNYLISFFTFRNITGDWELKILSPEKIPDTKQYSLTLSPGWNLFSIPLILADASPSAFIAPFVDKVRIIWGWDAGQWEAYKPDQMKLSVPVLDAIEPGKGYWIYMKEAVTATIEGTAP